jgi:prepilin-type processing-associated H-X9-DG protein
MADFKMPDPVQLEYASPRREGAPERPRDVAMACAIVGAVVPIAGGFLGLLAVLLGIVRWRAHRTGDFERRAARRVMIVGVVAIALSAGEWCGVRALAEQANRWKCRSNLSAIAFACIMYSNGERNGAFPDSARTLCETQQLSPDVFLCPSSNDTRAVGNTVDQVMNSLVAGGHDSYIYVGQGLTSRSPSNGVALYEPLDHHGSGSNVAFADGHAEFLDAAAVRQIIKMDQSGVRPIYWPPLPATRP